MDSNSRQKSAEKSQSKSSGGANSNSHKSSRSSSHHKGRNKSRERHRNDKRSSSGWKHQQRFGNSRHNSNRSYATDEYNHNKNYNSNWQNDSNWNRDTQRNNRSSRWNSSAPRFGNLTWQRNFTDSSNEGLNKSERATEGSSNQNYFRQDSESQPLYDRSHGPPEKHSNTSSSVDSERQRTPDRKQRHEDKLEQRQRTGSVRGPSKNKQNQDIHQFRFDNDFELRNDSQREEQHAGSSFNQNYFRQDSKSQPLYERSHGPPEKHNKANSSVDSEKQKTPDRKQFEQQQPTNLVREPFKKNENQDIHQFRFGSDFELRNDSQREEQHAGSSSNQNYFRQDSESQPLYDRSQGPPKNSTISSVDSEKQKTLDRKQFEQQQPTYLVREPSKNNENQDNHQFRFDSYSELKNDSQREEELPNQSSVEGTYYEIFELQSGHQSQKDLNDFTENIGFVKTEPAFFSTEESLLNIKPEPLEDTIYPEFNLANCLNVDIANQCPSISVIPISKLIKGELQDLNRADIIAPTTSARGRPTHRPNLVQRNRKSRNSNSESFSESLVQRVANMDKVGIKNVINNSGTKYDEALKTQARKKLREEIRMQLKSMNFTPPENSENSVLVPDEIVDSMNIPAVVLDEIRKAFGIVLVEDKKIIPNVEKTGASEEVAVPPPAQQSKKQSKSPDLMSRLKMLEEVKSQTDKVSPVRAEVTPKKHPNSKSKTTEDVVVINSSSSSSSSSSSDSDSDSVSTSTDSNASTTSSFKRRRRKKRILEANVVGNFESLILPNLTHAQRRRYKEKYCKTTKNSLLYIYGVCVSRANQNSSTNLDPNEKLRHKRNLTSADNGQSLEFLMKAILNLFEQQKENRRKSKETSTTATSLPTNSGIRSKHSNPVSPTKKLKDSKCNQGNTDNEQAKGQSKSAELPKHQSTKVDKTPPPPPEGGVNVNDDDSIAESANSAQGVASGGGRLVAPDTEDSESDSDNSSANGNPPSRQWKSPGEKKCIEIEASLPISSLGMMQPPSSIHSLELDSLKAQTSIGDEAVSSIREIDVKLMELHKRKIYIEEMILKLQKDKMEVDLWTMKLHNEKFILLNSALANASSTSSILVAPKTEKKTKLAVKRKSFATPFSEKFRNRKKRCQRDILLEDAENAFSRKKIPEKLSSTITKLVRQPRQTRQGKRAKRAQCEQTATTETIKTDAVVMVGGTTTIEKEYDKGDPVPEKIAEIPQVDYTDVPNGNLEGWKLPITQIIVVGEAIVAASEDGNIYKFNIRTRILESKFSKHTEAITQIFTCPRENFVYTTSLDGFLKKTSIENFGLELQSLNLQEPLQSIDIEWATAYIGSRWGNIFTYDIKSNNLSEALLCSSRSSIIAIKATKEGPRKILIVSSKGNQIHFRDAMTGLLLRSLDVPDNLHIYSILLDEDCIFCGTQRNEIHQYNFTTGVRMAIFQCGNGAVSMKLYKDKYIFVGCYDGFVYVLDRTTGCQIGRFPGSGKMILALEIAGDKLITSAKDNTMQIIDIPKYIVNKDKS